ncbi:MAG: DUF2851 family protein [Verrucomicrobia bacterium]|nr:DUF2851 family protein [Verrucomicrobiota bacterium]
MLNSPSKSNGKVSASPFTLYSQWRFNARPDLLLRDRGGSDSPNEMLLQQIWRYQRIDREHLRTADGVPLRILHPGFWNHESGPDFRDAIVQIGELTPSAGDIEIDLHPNNWRDHRHEGNPAYRSVVLHVVWEGETRVASGLPILALNNVLDAPISELRQWLDVHASNASLAFLEGKCSAPLRGLSNAQLVDIVTQAAQVRLQSKANHFEARARFVGWEQALWEGMFGALGYKQNSWPMRRIAELLPELRMNEISPKASLVLQAKFFGISGLLPSQFLAGKSPTENHVRSIWDVWWRERDRLIPYALPASIWRLHGVRPANHPHRRLALASQWIATERLLKRLEAWFMEPLADKEWLISLRRLLEGNPDPFWSFHHTLGSRRLIRSKPLLGRERTTDLAINVILPWFWARANAGNSNEMKRAAESRYFGWPGAQDNSVLRHARNRLMGGRETRVLDRAALQQGILQIVRDFCNQSNSLCEHCGFPDLVRHVETEHGTNACEPV